MALVAVTMVGAVALGYALGGRLNAIGAVQLRGIWLIGVAAGAQVAVAFTGGRWAAGVVLHALLVMSYAAVLAFVWWNRALPGLRAVFVGFSLNALVISVNGGMPVDPSALEAVGAPPADITGGKHLLLDERSRLAWLADVIPVPLLSAVISVGDIVLAAGFAMLIVRLMQHSTQE